MIENNNTFHHSFPCLVQGIQSRSPFCTEGGNRTPWEYYRFNTYGQVAFSTYLMFSLSRQGKNNCWLFHIFPQIKFSLYHCVGLNHIKMC